MTIPDYQSLMLPVLEIAAMGETSVPLAEAAIAARFGLSDEEREQMLPSGKQRVMHNRIHWAKFYLTKDGLQIGRATCRERGCQYVEISVVADTLKNKK